MHPGNFNVCHSSLLRNCLHSCIFKRSISLQACMFMPQRINNLVQAHDIHEDRTGSEKERHCDKKGQALSLSAMRLLNSQTLKPLQSKKKFEQQSRQMNAGDIFSQNFNKLAIEMNAAKTSIIEELDGADKLYLSDDTDDSLEFITLEDTDVESSKRKYSQILGSEDPSVAGSNIPCSGCGALLQCNNRTLPGFMASEYFKLLSEDELKGSICQRCYLMRQRNLFSEVSATPEEYAEMISKIGPTRSVVVMVVDVMDIDGSIIPNLPNYIGYRHPLIIVGNKSDLLAPDSPDYLKTVQSTLKKSCQKAGLGNIQKCMLVSAKTGFGIEGLISTLFSFYKRRVDVYIVGTANAGKSSLFNMLLGSDYCKHTARDLIQRATVSVWPGTTLNLLKFPIMRPSSKTMYLRHQRMKQKKALAREQARLKSNKSLNQSQKTWQLKDEVEVTDITSDTQRSDDVNSEAWGQGIVSFQGSDDGGFESISSQRETTLIEKEDFKDSYWMHDTPGIINPDQIINLLHSEENSLLVPESMIIPRTAVLHPNQTLFISGLARLDYVEGKEPVFLAIHSSPQLPVFIKSYHEADSFYRENIGKGTLAVPLGDVERLWKLPSLVGREYILQGIAAKTASADIQFSSVGWVSVAPRNHNEVVKMRAYTPGAKGLHMRSPSLLPSFSKFRGKRISGTQFYRTVDPGQAMVGKQLSLPSEDF